MIKFEQFESEGVELPIKMSPRVDGDGPLKSKLKLKDPKNMLHVMFQLTLTLVLALLAAAITTTFATSDVSLRVSQDVLNSASSVYFDAGVLSYVGELSINHKISTTNVFETLWPKAYEVCKNCPLLFTVKATT